MREKTLKGSLTVEAAWIMAMVLLSIAVMLQQACRIHDETKAAMGLHEALEKVRFPVPVPAPPRQPIPSGLLSSS